MFDYTFIMNVFVGGVFSGAEADSCIYPRAVNRVDKTFASFLMTFKVTSVGVSIMVRCVVPLLVLLISKLVTALVCILIVTHGLVGRY